MQHDVEEKISPAFQPFLAESDPHDRRDAIVIFRAPQPEGIPVRGRIRALKQRLDMIKAQARAQTPVQAKVTEKYQKSAALKKPNERRELELETIGGSAAGQQDGRLEKVSGRAGQAAGGGCHPAQPEDPLDRAEADRL